MKNLYNETVLYLGCGGGNMWQNCVEWTHTQMSTCKNGELWIRLADSTDVSFLIEILYFCDHDVAIGGN